MKFCAKCGTQNADNAVFCKVCGGPLASPQPGAAPAGAPPMGGGAGVRTAPGGLGGMDKNKLIGIIAIAVAAVLLVVLLATVVFGGASDKGLVKKYYKAIYKQQDGDKMLALYHEDVVKTLRGDTSEKKYANAMTELYETQADNREKEFKKWNYKLEVLASEKFNKDDLKSIDETYDENFKLEVKDAMRVWVKVTEVQDGQKQASFVRSFILVKIEGRWYMHYNYMASSTSRLDFVYYKD